MVQKGHALRLPLKRAFELVTNSCNFGSVSERALTLINSCLVIQITLHLSPCHGWQSWQAKNPRSRWRRATRLNAFSTLWWSCLPWWSFRPSSRRSPMPWISFEISTATRAAHGEEMQICSLRLASAAQVEVQVIIPKQSPVTRWGAIQSPGIS